MSDKSNFFIRRVHSLLAIIPIGIFLIFHLTINSSVFFGGNHTYEMVIGFMKNIPLIEVAEIIIIAIPILFHAIYGLWIVYVAKNNVLKFTYYRNWAFYLQRITAIITLIFILFHVYTLRLSIHEPAQVVDTFVRQLQNPLFFALYIIGVISAIYHFANGLFTFLITWGITIGDNSQNFFSKFSTVLFVALGFLGIGLLTVISRL
ncbi:MAG: succinate dehydrogenase [Dehalobacterium sp.]